jgi:c-di-GMP-binding flagellar brake protein YcgR
MAWDGVERRGRKRYGVKDAIVRYKKGLLSFLAPASQKYLVLNLSETGLEFITKEQVHEGRKLTVLVSAPPVRGTVHARGRVIWIRKSQEQDAFRVGLEFTSISDRSRAYLKALLDSAVVDSIEISTRVYLKELDKL